MILLTIEIYIDKKNNVILLFIIIVLMSANSKTSQFLKQVYSNNPQTQNIELEFMQISDLNEIIHLLSKFSNLKKLSLHGNRIKELPMDLSKLVMLQQIDISNNMLTNCDMMIMCLKTLPRLKRLVCPFKKQQQDKIKKGLPMLEYLNNSKIEREKNKIFKTDQKKTSKFEIKATDIEEAASLFDKIRQCYKETYEQYNDSELKTEFNQQIERLMSEMKLNQDRLNSNQQNLKNIIFLTTKFSFFKISQSKFLQLITDVQQKYGIILNTIFVEYGKLLKSMTQIAMDQPSQIINKYNPNFEQQKNIKQKYQKQLKRLRKQKDQLMFEITSLQTQNKKYLDTLIRHTKGQLNFNSTAGQKRENSSSKRFVTNTIQQKNIPAKTKQFIISPNPAGKNITLKQLKDTIQQIYDSKVKFDQKTYDSKLPRETMYQYLFTFLNQKYGLKNLTIQWASSIVTGIQTYSNQDNDVAVFGKILRNQCEEQFRFVQMQVKNTINQLLKMHLKTKFPYKTAVQINEIINQKINNYVNSDECQDIVRYMYNKQDSNDLIEKLKLIYALQPRQYSTKQQTRRLTREQQINLLQEKQKKKLKYQAFLKCVLDFQLRSHEKYLKPLIQIFKGIDRDADGIVNEEQFIEILNQMCQQGNELVTKFLNIVDPYSTNTITFTQICKLFSNYPENNPILARYLKQP